jgi:hypothetical protein
MSSNNVVDQQQARQENDRRIDVSRKDNLCHFNQAYMQCDLWIFGLRLASVE